MKTTIYIDGYNLYYGALRNTAYKWLDIVQLFSGICHIQNPTCEVVAVKFFTAPVKSKLATHGELSFKSQNDYHRALQMLYPDHVDVILGYFTVTEGWFPKYQTPIDKADKIKAWRLEEKQTDVNIALQMYRDVQKGLCDQAVLVSNDSDQTPTLRSIREDFPALTVGTIIPRLQAEGKSIRPYSTELAELSHWTRGHIREGELRSAQLPALIPTQRKPILKPSYW